MQLVKQHHQTFVRRTFEGSIELLHFKPRSCTNLVGFLEHVHNNLRHGRRGHLDCLTLRIKDSSKAHDLRDSHIRLGAYTGKALGELSEVRS